jgi:hypothetical protein
VSTSDLGGCGATNNLSKHSPPPARIGGACALTAPDDVAAGHDGGHLIRTRLHLTLVLSVIALVACGVTTSPVPGRSDDFYRIADLPSNTAAAAGTLTAAATGAIATRTVVLMTPEEVDAATKLTPNYRPPGRLSTHSTGG